MSPSSRDLLERMRANPASDWRIADVEKACREFDIRCVPPSGGSHDKISHASQRQILTMPFRRPIKAVYPQARAVHRHREKR